MSEKVGTRNISRRGRNEEPMKWLPTLPQVCVLVYDSKLLSCTDQKRTKPNWQDLLPEFKLFPGVTPEMIGAEQRPHTSTVSGLPSLLRPPTSSNGRQQLGKIDFITQFFYNS